MCRRFRLRHAVISVAVLSGCASIDPFADPSSPTRVSTQTVSSRFNDADVTFLNAMLSHEREVVALAERALEPASNAGADVTTIADHLADEAEGRIESMAESLNEWNQVDSTDLDVVPTVGRRLDDLVGLSGPDFEQLWVELMVEHHATGIGLAEAVQRDGVSREVNKFASGMLVDLGFEASQLGDLGKVLSDDYSVAGDS